MRTTIILILGVTLAAGCGSASSHSGKRPVAASFYPLAFAAGQVGGPGVEVDDLTPPGVEPHDLEVSPKTVARVREADLVLLLGRDFQPQLESAAGHGSNVLRLLDTPGLAVHSNNDPHVWLDPLRYVLIVRRIGVALHEPGRARALIRRLRALDRDYRLGLAHCQRREIVTSHEAFAYLGERYGLHQIAITGLSPEAEPAPRKLQQVIELVRKSGATTVFFETLVSPRLADTVARETGARTAVLDPIEGAKNGDYFTIMHRNLAALRDALACR